MTTHHPDLNPAEIARRGDLFDALTVAARRHLGVVGDHQPVDDLDVLLSATCSSLTRLPLGYSPDSRVLRHVNVRQYNTLILGDTGGMFTKTVLAGLARAAEDTRVLVLNDFLDLFREWQYHVAGFVDEDPEGALFVLRDYALQAAWGLLDEPQHLTLVVNRIDLWADTVPGDYLRTISASPMVSVIATVPSDADMSTVRSLLGRPGDDLNIILGNEDPNVILTADGALPVVPLPVVNPALVPVPDASLLESSFLPESMFGQMMEDLSKAGVATYVLEALVSPNRIQDFSDLDLDEDTAFHLFNLLSDDEALLEAMDDFLGGHLQPALDAIHDRVWPQEEPLELDVDYDEDEHSAAPQADGIALSDDQIDAVIRDAISSGVWADITGWDEDVVSSADEVFGDAPSFEDAEPLPVEETVEETVAPIASTPAPEVVPVAPAPSETTPSEVADGGDYTVPDELRGKWNTLLAIGKTEAEAATILGLDA